MRPFTGSKNNLDDIDIERGHTKEGDLSQPLLANTRF